MIESLNKLDGDIEKKINTITQELPKKSTVMHKLQYQSKVKWNAQYYRDKINVENWFNTTDVLETKEETKEESILSMDAISEMNNPNNSQIEGDERDPLKMRSEFQF